MKESSEKKGIIKNTEKASSSLKKKNRSSCLELFKRNLHLGLSKELTKFAVPTPEVWSLYLK